MSDKKLQIWMVNLGGDDEFVLAYSPMEAIDTLANSYHRDDPGDWPSYSDLQTLTYIGDVGVDCRDLGEVRTKPERPEALRDIAEAAKEHLAACTGGATSDYLYQTQRRLSEAIASASAVDAGERREG